MRIRNNNKKNETNSKDKTKERGQKFKSTCYNRGFQADSKSQSCEQNATIGLGDSGKALLHWKIIMVYACSFCSGICHSRSTLWQDRPIADWTNLGMR